MGGDEKEKEKKLSGFLVKPPSAPDGEVVLSHFDPSSVERCTEIRVELPVLSADVIVHASQWGSVALWPVGQDTSLTFQSNDNPR
ncbi:hypothetical protein V6N13_139468 [Hibiscus sabdariffa]